MRFSWDMDLSREDLTQASREIFDLPAFAQVFFNAYSMTNFSPIFERVGEIFPPKHICEVGVDQGELSLFLMPFAKRHGAQLTLVDNAWQQKTLDLLAQNVPEGFSYNQVDNDSRVYLGEANTVDWFIIDGDHNYSTVLQELELIADQFAQRPGIVFMHDVGWPHARRNFYYNSDGTDDYPSGEGGYLTPFTENAVEVGYRSYIPFAQQEGGPQNGVLTAVEDFLVGHKGWSFFRVNLFYGLGVLWNPAMFTEEQNAGLDALKATFEALHSLHSTAELNRIMLLMFVEQNGQDWHKSQELAAELYEKLDEAHTDRESLRAQVVAAGEMWEQNQSYIKQLEANAATAGEVQEQNQAHIKQLEGEVAAAGEVWNQNQAYIQQLEAELSISREASVKLRGELVVAQSQNQALESQVTQAGHEWHENQTYIQSLQAENNGLREMMRDARRLRTEIGLRQAVRLLWYKLVDTVKLR